MPASQPTACTFLSTSMPASQPTAHTSPSQRRASIREDTSWIEDAPESADNVVGTAGLDDLIPEHLLGTHVLDNDFLNIVSEACIKKGSTGPLGSVLASRLAKPSENEKLIPVARPCLGIDEMHVRARNETVSRLQGALGTGARASRPCALVRSIGGSNCESLRTNYHALEPHAKDMDESLAEVERILAQEWEEERLKVENILSAPPDDSFVKDLNLLEYQEINELIANTVEDVKRLQVAMDSGSEANVVSPDDLPGGVEIAPNLTGNNFNGAGGDPITRHGSVKTLMEGARGKFTTDWQVADVTRALHSVSKVTGPEEHPTGL